MNKYKTFEELKEELGDKFEEYMYKSNIELLTKIDKAIEYIKIYRSYENIDGKDYLKNRDEIGSLGLLQVDKLLEILGGKE